MRSVVDDRPADGYDHGVGECFPGVVDAWSPDEVRRPAHRRGNRLAGPRVRPAPPVPDYHGPGSRPARRAVGPVGRPRGRNRAQGGRVRPQARRVPCRAGRGREPGHGRRVDRRDGSRKGRIPGRQAPEQPAAGG